MHHKIILYWKPMSPSWMHQLASLSRISQAEPADKSMGSASSSDSVSELFSIETFGTFPILKKNCNTQHARIMSFVNLVELILFNKIRHVCAIIPKAFSTIRRAMLNLKKPYKSVCKN